MTKDLSESFQRNDSSLIEFKSQSFKGNDLVDQAKKSQEEKKVLESVQVETPDEKMLNYPIDDYVDQDINRIELSDQNLHEKIQAKKQQKLMVKS